MALIVMSLAFDGLIAKAEPGDFSHQSRNVPTSTFREYIFFFGSLQPHSFPNTQKYLAQLLALRQLLERVPLVTLCTGVQSRRCHSPQQK